MTSTMGQIEALSITYLLMTASSWPEPAVVLLPCKICPEKMDANRPIGTQVNTLPSPQEYGLTVGYIQRYKIPTGTCIFVCVFIMLELAPACPTMREWRNWQTRET